MKRILGAVTAAALSAGYASAQPDRYCTGLAPLIEVGVLYTANCATGANCLRRVVNQNGAAYLQKIDSTEIEPLARWKSYHFIYKVGPGGVPNSLVVVQLKWSDTRTKPRDKIVGVNLRRKAFDFACYRTSRNIHFSDWPPAEVPRDKIPAIPYSEYDQFHRYGYTTGKSDSYLHDEFHVRYFNGETCVATTEPRRRAQFLMHDRRDFRGRIAAFFAQLGWDVGPPSTEELDKMRDYEKLKVVVSNYQKRPDEGGCFGFAAKGGYENTSALDLTISDMEAQMRNPLFDVSQSWSFGVK